MTGQRDFDRLAQAWLELGPDEAPDRVVAAVLQAAQTTPQARRPIRWLRLRDDKMTRLPVLATVAATIVIVVGGLLLINRPNDHGVGAPSASPSSSASPAAAPLNLALRSTRWMGSERPFVQQRLTMKELSNQKWRHVELGTSEEMAARGACHFVALLPANLAGMVAYRKELRNPHLRLGWRLTLAAAGGTEKK